MRLLLVLMKKQYEAWQDGNSITFGTAEGIQEQRSNGELSEQSVLLHRIEADTYEEAMAAHHIRMGWEQYVPMGMPRECPRGCGAVFYPEGSGECPNCGRIC